ncbi:hypothetical protein MAM1_0145d06514 [Mucor ambiguus]|uniref:Uncharacterized protein n=1 Tax=Mucor ambiguus TaxID=91626 RepID=A0A0C9MI48_9FUNG|nr:hypothetical protein MAM1_0145d06514 [Mucor ambiguus]
MLAVFIIAKAPTILLAGFVLGYFMLFNKQDTEEKTPKLIEAPPQQPPSLTPRTSSLEYDNEPHYASINHSVLTQEEDQQDDISNASIDFEHLLKFPSCPTTLPRLDTHFNFVSDDHHQLQQNNSIDWSAIHQELEYDQQRNIKPPTVTMEKEPQHPLYISPSQNDMLTFSSASSSSSSSSEDADVSSLLSLESTSILKQTSVTSPKTPLPPNDNNTAAILLVDQPDYLALPPSSSATDRAVTSYTSYISNMALLDDILLLPTPTPLPKPSLSSPGQLFKSKFQKAVNKMKKSNSNSGNDSSNSNSRRSSTISQDSFTANRKASSLQIQAYFLPQQQQQQQPLGSPRPSASARLNDHLKGRFHKLFKK